MQKSNFIFWATVCATAFSHAKDTPWADDLALGRGDVWRNRRVLAVTNTSDKAVAGAPARLAAAALAGVRVEELRLVDEHGVELLLGVWAKGNRVESGRVPREAELALPVTLPPKGGATYWLYWGNASAWGCPDFFDGKAKPCGNALATWGGGETLTLNEQGKDAPWAKAAAECDLRVSVRVTNLSDAPQTASLSSISLTEALRGAAADDLRLFDGERRLDLCRVGNRAFFVCDVPQRTRRTYWLYARTAARRAKPARDEVVRTALGSIIPSDQVLVTRDDVPDLAAYRALVNGPANLLKNPCFAEGLKAWAHPSAKHDAPVRYEASEAGGRLGGGFAKMSIPAEAHCTWRGFRQAVPIEAGRSYFFGGFISCENADAPTSIYAHVIDRDGKSSQMTSTATRAVANSPWTATFGTVTAMRDDMKFELHLTTNARGTYAYDGLVVAAFLPTRTGEIEFRAPPAASSALAVAAVDPIVKVFRETPVTDAHEFSVALARRETEPLQLAVRAAKDIGDLALEVVAPSGLVAEVGWVGFVPVDYPTAYYHATTPKWELKRPTSAPSSDGWSGWWPDPIAPENHGAVRASETQPVWVNFKTTAETKPGDYAVRLLWKANGQTVRSDACRVRVWNFTLPAVAETPAIYDIRLGSKHWQADTKGLSADARREMFWAFFSEKRICPDSLECGVKFTRGKDGRVTADFADYDRVAARYFGTYNFPHSYMPHDFNCFGWGMPPRKFLGEDPYEGTWPYEGVDRSVLRPAYKAAYQAALRLYWNHVTEKGWADRLVLYISDEPHFSVKAVERQMVALCEMIHEVSPAIRIYSSTWRHCPTWNGSLDIWGVGHYGCFPTRVMRELAQAGRHVWFTTDGQMCLDTPYCAAERMYPHYCAAFNAEAYEFWGATWLTYDPWKYGWHAYIKQSDTPGKHYYIRYPDGDGYLIYPGIEGRFKGPVTSVRLEAARDGVEDFSYLKALERLSRRTDEPRAAQAKALLAEFRALVSIPNAGGRFSTRTLPDPTRVGALRLRAGELLDGAFASK